MGDNLAGLTNLVKLPATGAGESELVVVQNWFEELRARVGK
jgi:hypothetical protein